MTCVSLQLVSLGALLTFSFSASLVGGSRCVSEEQMEQRIQKFLKKTSGQWNGIRPHPSTQECEKVAKEKSSEPSERSLSPWKYTWNEDSSRVPPKILFAECLCTGCLINQQENHNYNSVPVFSVLRVLMKTRCQDDPNKYAVTEDFINVPVACTCVAPVVYEA